MKLNGIHHITAITAEAQRNVDFYAGLLGLRLVKKTVNQDQPTIYHLFYGDEEGRPGLDLTFFEFPGASLGRAGDGMVHRVVWRVGDEAALDFWERRLADSGCDSESIEGRPALCFRDFEGLEHELLVSDVSDPPLIADHPDVPAEHALRGFDGVVAYASHPERSRELLVDVLGFDSRDERLFESRGEARGSLYAYHNPPVEPGRQSAGSVHHVAWASTQEDHEAWRKRLVEAGARPTPIIDRHYFRSIYFREPSGVLFEIATIGPGFTVDEPLEHLGERLSLPPFLEHMRAEVEPLLTPIVNPRQVRA